MVKDFSIYGEDILKQPTSLVMSGVESDTYWDIAIGEGIERMLVSYHYIQRKGKNFLRNRLSKHPHIKLMIDSGAHTFHAKEEEFKDKPMEFWENYLEKYTSFVKANKDFIFSCVELDIANLIGFDKVDYFREKYFEPLKEEGILVCYVWHEYDGDKHWEEMCQKYDYVGFSLTNGSMTDSDIVRKVNIARRYGALIHGFAVTRTELMSKVPFFTGDSTTWLVGTQYGELNWFDGRKMKRLKKDKWKTEYRQRYIKLGAKPDLFDEENPYELIRINLIVFRQAEEYIRKRIRGKAYWIKQGTPTKKVSSLRIKRKKVVPEQEQNEVRKEEEPMAVERPKTKFEDFQAQSKTETRELEKQLVLIPDLEWFDGESEDYDHYVNSLGLDVNGNDKEFVLDFLYNCRVYLLEQELLDDQDDEVVIDVAKFYTNRTFTEREEALNATIEVLEKNLTLESKSAFPRPAMSEMEAIERPKERDEYLQDEEYEIVDVPVEEMMSLLPAPLEGEEMPEVDELDKELMDRGIVAVRDEKGRFLKGQKRVRKPKQIYSKQFPKLACNTCYKAGDCPEYKPDHVCAFDKIFNQFDVRNTEDVLDAMNSMVNLNLGRMQRMAMFEIMDGGMADGTVTSMIDQNMNLLGKLQQLQEMQKQVMATQHRTIMSDGTMHETTTVTNPSGGILSQIFGGGSSGETDRPRKDITDVTDVMDEEDLGENDN